MVIKIWNNNKDKHIELKILSDMPNYSNEFTVSSNSFKPIFQKIKSVNHMEKVIFSLINTG